ncbi:septum formation initiator family protein [Bacteroidales bacterium OttesenSCG-928-I21]|nr:septum formation initiator family protein [Bacteroidales bacterium OttesenSCG-928-I21]
MKKIVKKIWSFIKFVFGNKYRAAIVIFAIWIFFLDPHNVIDRIKSLENLKKLKKEAVFFKEKIDFLETQYNELFSEKSEIEKFAREHFLMKEENEDIFIVVKE